MGDLCLWVRSVLRWLLSSGLTPRFYLHRCSSPPPLPFFPTPPLRGLTFAYLHPHTSTHNISVAMATMCDAPRFPCKDIALSNPLLCLFKDEGRCQRVEPTLCVSSKCICAVWGLLCVCVSPAGMTQECRTGCRKKIPESMWKTHSEVPVTVTQRHMRTLNYVPRV